MSSSADPEAWRNERPQVPAPQVIPPPPVQTFTLENGLTIHVVENHRLPLITTAVVVHGGLADAPRGAASVVATSIARATRTSSPAEFADRIGSLGGVVRADLFADYSLVVVDALAERWQDTLQLVADAVLHPDLRAPYVTTLTTELTSQLNARLRSDAAVAIDTVQHLVYGDHPYGWTRTDSPQQFAKVTAREAQAFYGARWRPANCELVVAGDVDASRARAVVAEVFGKWRGRDGRAPALPAAGPPPPSQLIVVDRPTAKQVTVVAGTRAVARGSRAWYPALIANRILGGAFDSRLNTSLRQTKGWVYAIRSTLVGQASDGFIYALTSVKPEKAAETAKEVFEQLEGLRTRPPTTAELDIARSASRLHRALDLETNGDLATAVAGLVGLSLPPSELALSFAKLEAVTESDVQAVAAEHLTTEGTSMVIVGPAATLLPQLRAQGLTPVEAPARK